ncbi:hypothetical protein PT974_06170 [Cladobotryum mycophilum]|uniref:G-patch domain-containing protein n=1 Tax=Cladobotryum mycophilum TaxID=491253 RepID=A0ABR0SKR6_9HYPO
MNAHAILSAQGWRGTGHSLHKTDDSIGLAKPLLLNRKDNKKGLGQKQHFTSDQWWMNAFDEQLKGLDTTKDGQVIQTVKSGKLNALDKGALAKYSVYTTFVRGGFLEGTISTPELTDGSSVSDNSEEKESPPSAMEGSKPKKESKEERRARKEAKRKRKEEKSLRKAARAARRERKAAKKEKKEKEKEKEKKREEKESRDSIDKEKRLRRARKEEKRRLGKLKEEEKDKS